VGFKVTYIIVAENDGGFSIISTNLPGCCSQGESRFEALMNLTEAFKGVAKVYLEELGTIPFGDTKVDNWVREMYPEKQLEEGEMIVELEDFD